MQTTQENREMDNTKQVTCKRGGEISHLTHQPRKPEKPQGIRPITSHEK